MSDPEWDRHMEMSAKGICPECDKPYGEHTYPEKAPCPRCGSIEHVQAWEAWGHPNGELVCFQCCYGRTKNGDYFTFYVEDGAVKISEWETVEPAAEPGVSGREER